MGRMLYLGDDIVLPGNGYPPLAAFQIPFVEDLLGVSFGGGGAETVLKDWSGNAEFAAVGSPTYGPAATTVSGAGYIQTDIQETLAMTIVTAFRETTNTQVGVAGNYLNGSSIGVALFVNASSTTITATAGRTGGAGGSASVGSNTSAWGVYSFRVPASGAGTLKNHVTGAANVTSGTAARVVSSTRPMLIGALYDSAFSGSSEYLITMFYSRALSAAEADIVAEFCRAYAATNGVSITFA